jgi:hypothetical protein
MFITVYLLSSQMKLINVDNRDDANQHEGGQPNCRSTNPPPLSQVTEADLQYLNDDGEISMSDDDNKDPLDGDWTYDLPTSLGDILDQ